MKVRLSTYEVMVAAEVGKMRTVSSMKADYPNRHGMPERDWDADIEGAAGEMVVARAFGLYWDCSVNTFKRADLPFRIQVRTTAQKSLIVRPDDDDEDVFVLVRGRSPEFEVAGWMLGRDAKRDCWSQAPNGRPAAWFVPPDALSPPEALIARLAA